MHRPARALVLAVTLGLLLPVSAYGAETSIGANRPDRSDPRLYTAQYDGQPFEGPLGAPPGVAAGYPGPYGGPGFNPYRGRAAPRSRRHARSAGERVSYHGFRIDLSNVAASPNLASELAAIEHQIDIVDSVGLSASELRLFRSLPIRISNGLTGGGHYNGGKFVVMGNLLAADTRPVLLHEYMHVLHHDRFPGGFGNTTIRRFYEEAVENNLYPQGSYMLSNPGEFFAMTASCFLYGSVARPPYTRDAIRTQQPDYYSYLEQLFGRARTSRARPAALSQPVLARSSPWTARIASRPGQRPAT